MSKPLATPRITGRALAARLFRAAREALAATDDSASGRAVAKRWGIDHAMVDRWADPTSGVALTLGDLLAMPQGLAMGTLTGAIAALSCQRDATTRDTLDGVAIVLGETLAAWRRDLAADGREDEHARHAAALRKIAAIALSGAAACDRRATR